MDMEIWNPPMKLSNMFDKVDLGKFCRPQAFLNRNLLLRIDD